VRPQSLRGTAPGIRLPGNPAGVRVAKGRGSRSQSNGETWWRLLPQRRNVKIAKRVWFGGGNAATRIFRQQNFVCKIVVSQLLGNAFLMKIDIVNYLIPDRKSHDLFHPAIN